MAAQQKALKLWHAPNTRCFRIVWLMEELGLSYELERTEFIPPEKSFFQQSTPTGKFPTLQDGNIVMCESGAITEYVLECYGEGKLAPAIDTSERAAYLQWLHFADSTAFPPIGILIWLLLYREGKDDNPSLIEDAMARASVGMAYLEEKLGNKKWLVGDQFTAADIMVGFTLAAAQLLGVLDERYPVTNAYFERLQQRPAFVAAQSKETED